MQEYTLPEWAFLDAHSHLGNLLGNRTVILHVRSASVIEIADREKDGLVLVENILKFNFKYTSQLGVERLSAILHYSATLDKGTDRDIIINDILRPCAIWYCDYCAWEDNNIIKSYFNGE